MDVLVAGSLPAAAHTFCTRDGYVFFWSIRWLNGIYESCIDCGGVTTLAETLNCLFMRRTSRRPVGSFRDSSSRAPEHDPPSASSRGCPFHFVPQTLITCICCYALLFRWPESRLPAIVKSPGPPAANAGLSCRSCLETQSPVPPADAACWSAWETLPQIGLPWIGSARNSLAPRPNHQARATISLILMSHIRHRLCTRA